MAPLHALAAVEFGLRVVPGCANGELLVNPKQATCDPQIITAIWARWPFADVAWIMPLTVVAAVVDNRYRRFAQFGGDDARSVETPGFATETGGACLLFAASSGPYRNRTAIKDAGGDEIGVEILFGAHIMLPSVGSGREWIRQLSETAPAPGPDWISRAAIISAAEPKTGNLLKWTRSPSWSSSRDPIIADALTVARALGCRKVPHRGNFSCHCPKPSHRNGDRRPSLSVRNGDDGRLMLHCFGDCSFAEITESLRQRGILPRRSR
jgi:hypothetical protein